MPKLRLKKEFVRATRQQPSRQCKRKPEQALVPDSTSDLTEPINEEDDSDSDVEFLGEFRREEKQPLDTITLSSDEEYSDGEIPPDDDDSIVEILPLEVIDSDEENEIPPEPQNHFDDFQAAQGGHMQENDIVQNPNAIHIPPPAYNADCDCASCVRTRYVICRARYFEALAQERYDMDGWE